MNRPVIVWFRNDLRIFDNPALSAAANTGAPLVPVFVLDDGTDQFRPLGSASRWWLHQSIRELARTLRARGVTLILRHGRAERIVPGLAADLGASGVFWNFSPEPGAVTRDKDVMTALDSIGVAHCRSNGSLLVEPEEIATSEGKPYRVFSPFWRRVRERCRPDAPGQVPSVIAAYRNIETDNLDDWNLQWCQPDRHAGLRDAWIPGETAALARLEQFVASAMADYPADRDHPERAGTSGLSPYLRWGEIAPTTVWRRVAPLMDEASPRGEAAAAFLRELAWREFNQHLMVHWPTITERNLRPEFDEMSWRQDPEGLRAWQNGRTGYPLVDAGMRELRRTGWMHNRVRMVAASFLVKDLLIHWREGEAWFWDALVDADAGNNSGNWQWVAGSGADAAPFFRIFNPVTQSRKFDPDGVYIRRWVPELLRLPAKWLHTPWLAPDAVLDSAGVIPDRTYPRPIVDHASARRRALAAFNEMRRTRRQGP